MTIYERSSFGVREAMMCDHSGQTAELAPGGHVEQIFRKPNSEGAKLQEDQLNHCWVYIPVISSLQYNCDGND